MTTPVFARRMRGIRIFGLTCLGVGITLVVLIISSMIFGYN